MAFLPSPMPLPALVGRDRERSILRERLTGALAGRGGLVLIGGEAGIGKTALAEALCREAEQNAQVLVGRCYDLTETPPYGPWVELFRHYPPGDDLPALPVAFVQPGAIGDVTSQGALFEQTRRFFAATHRPLVLLLDDLQWSDQESLDLLRSLARTLAGLPLLLLATYRADELTRRHPLAQLIPQLVREAAAVRVDLHRLDDDAVRLLVTERYQLAEAEAARLVDYLQGRAEGNSLFVGELLRALEEAGILRQEGARWALGYLALTAVPTLLRQVIAARVDRLGEVAKALLGVAAVIGQEVPYAVWSAVAQTDEATLIAVVEQVEGARVMEETADGVAARFTHALIREALYAEVRPSQRRGWHRTVGDVLAAGASPDPDAVAYHFQQAGDPRAAVWLIQAGERAQRAYAWLTAAARYESALALLASNDTGTGERGWLLVRVALLRRFTDPRRGIADLDEATEVAAIDHDRTLETFALLCRGLLHCFAGDIRQGLAEQEAGVAMVQAISVDERARLQSHAHRAMGVDGDGRGTLALWLAHAGRYGEALTVGEGVVAETVSSPHAWQGTTLGDAFYGLAEAYAALGRPDDARRTFIQARERYRASGQHSMLGSTAVTELTTVLLPYRADAPGEWRDLAATGGAAWHLASEASQGVSASYEGILLALFDEHWPDVRQLTSLVAVDRRGSSIQASARSVLCQLAYFQGNREIALAQIMHMLRDGPATEPGDSRALAIPTLQRTAIALALDAGDWTKARTWLGAHDRWLSWSGAVLGLAEGQLGWAAYHRAVGDAPAAYRYATQAREHATNPRQPLALLAAHRLLGELDGEAGREEDAAAHLDASLDLADACQSPYERALTLLALAELQAKTGERTGALSVLDEVRAICAPLGAHPALARADAIAATIVRAPPHNPARLSVREVEGLRLLAAGKTNREIAGQLFLSERTVNVHINHIYTKAGVDNRAAATAFAYQHDLT